MRKTVLSTLILLGLNQATASQDQAKDLNVNYGSGSTIDKQINEYAFTIARITEYTKDQITEFWKNKTDGEFCSSLFGKIVDHYEQVKVEIHELDGWIEQYNTKCSDKCLPGYVRCEGDFSGHCIKECDCCANHYLSCCHGTQNHPANSHNYATGEGESLQCYDWCCPEDHTRCQDNCYPDSSPMPYGYGPSSVQYDNYHNPLEYPKVCCGGQGCCDAGETYIKHLTTDAPFCCKLDSIVQEAKLYGDAICCCENESDVCCPNLAHHCQPSTNTHCCADDEIVCHGQCWPKNKPCCDAPAYNCAAKNDACVEYCCCDYTQDCCEKRKQCIPQGSLCCGWDEQECNGKCIPKDDHCCSYGTSWCEYTKKCSEHCCDEYNGYTWCEYSNQCEKHCCPKETPYCSYSDSCSAHCCPLDKPYCQWTDKCEVHCCEWSHTKHEIWCSYSDKCEDECNCCAAGTKACKCNSGTYDVDTHCYDINGQECCEHYWCAAAKKCVANEIACCEETYNSYVGDHTATYDSKYCCPLGSTDFSLGVNGEKEVGCCTFNALSPKNSNCCRAPNANEAAVTYNPITHHCDITELPPCPCEGCCDFNCCDELDFFMHRAYFEHYKEEYSTFMKFYDDWYAGFAEWWTQPQNNNEYPYDDSKAHKQH